MPPRSRSFNTRRPRRVERKRILIVTEGEKTEVQYLEGLAQYLRSTGAAVRGVSAKGIGRDPGRVLQAAVRLAADDSDGFDEVWIVVDVDDHATLDSCLRDGRRRVIPVVVSNPCFEIWLLWHFEDRVAYCTNKWLKDRLAECGHVGKAVATSFPFAGVDEAERRAETTVSGHSQIGPNPSSSMPFLVRALRRA